MKPKIGRTLLCAGALLIVGLLFLVVQGRAVPAGEPPQPEGEAQPMFSYQGTLTDQNGNPITGTVTMIFALYDDPTSGSKQWGPEVQTVTISNGLFYVVLGSVSPITARTLPDDLYLGITVNGEELWPRERLTSVPYAMDAWRLSGGGNRIMAEGGTPPHVRLYSVNGIYAFIDIDNNQTDQVFQILRDMDGFPATPVFTVGEDGSIDATGALDMNGNSVVNCGALTEANLQTAEERATGGSARFEEGDVLCWDIDRLEKCFAANDRLVQAVADGSGRPIVIGAEVIKVVGPVKRGDILVASEVPGYAMVNNDPTPGSVIAQALEDSDGGRGLIRAMIRKF